MRIGRDNSNAVAWVLMVSAVAVHVFDETITDFLPFYNSLVLDLRERIGFSLLPMFSFELWLGGLITGIIIAFLITPLVKRGGRIIRVFTTVIGVIMAGGALGHIFGSLYLGRLAPGFWSSPLLLVTAVLVVITGVRQKREGPGEVR